MPGPPTKIADPTAFAKQFPYRDFRVQEGWDHSHGIKTLAASIARGSSTWGGSSTSCGYSTSSIGSSPTSCQNGSSAPMPNPWTNYKAGNFQLARTDTLGPTIPKPYIKSRTNFAHRIETISWQGLDLVPVKKDFSYIEHPDVQDRSPIQCEQIRVENSIIIIDDDGLDVPKPLESFTEIAFPEWAVQKIQSKGFKRPTGIQCQAWPVLMKGHDLIGIAETGSGKTLAYVLPMLIHLEAQSELLPGEGPGGLILVPNRELCEQVERQVNEFSSGAGLTCLSIFGGCGPNGIEERNVALERRCDVIVATPGVLISLLEDKLTNLKRTTFVVLDEADELLSEGFEYQIRLIMSQVRPDRQVSMFSATWEDDSLRQLAREACSCRPIHINVGSTKLAACKTITQKFVIVGSTENTDVHFKDMSKVEVLVYMLKGMFKRDQEVNQGENKFLVFCNNREKVPEILGHLQEAGISCEGFTADYTQLERENILKSFRDPENHLPLLVCTSLLGRGHDFANLRYVINFDMPKRLAEYVHRIGRTGRGGEAGDALTLVEEVDLVLAKEIRECLLATSQRVPEWIHTACTNKAQKKYRALAYEAVHGPSEPKPMLVAGSPVREPVWKGRGKGGLLRRREWLAECASQGAAREPDPPDILL